MKFTTHARDQMRARGITEREVVEVLVNPVQTVATRANRLASYAPVQGNYIVVIHEKENHEDRVITTMKVNRRRLAKLGFTQI